jgi:dTDP-4-amino-4,6-dideoxygalactose transaminase
MYHDVIGGARTGVPEEMRNGMNFRMGELQAAIMLVQLRRLEGLLADMRRRKAVIKDAIREVARNKGVDFRTIHDSHGDTAISLVFFAPTADRAVAISHALNAEGVGAFVVYEAIRPDFHVYCHWTPVLEKRVWSDNGGPWRHHPRPIVYERNMCRQSLDLLGRSVHVDISPDLTASNVDELAAALCKVLNALL